MRKDLVLARGRAGKGLSPPALGQEQGEDPACNLEPSLVGQGQIPNGSFLVNLALVKSCHRA